jgi:hypothetical protein
MLYAVQCFEEDDKPFTVVTMRLSNMCCWSRT